MGRGGENGREVGRAGVLGWGGGKRQKTVLEQLKINKIKIRVILYLMNRIIKKLGLHFVCFLFI